jgi:hypothetical protein
MEKRENPVVGCWFLVLGPTLAAAAVLANNQQPTTVFKLSLRKSKFTYDFTSRYGGGGDRFGKME